MIMRLSSSGLGCHVVFDDGSVFVFPVSLVRRLFDGGVRSKFLVGTRLPDRVDIGRFPSSPLWDKDRGVGVRVLPLGVSSVVGSDVILNRGRSKVSGLVPFGDVVV